MKYFDHSILQFCSTIYPYCALVEHRFHQHLWFPPITLPMIHLYITTNQLHYHSSIKHVFCELKKLCKDILTITMMMMMMIMMMTSMTIQGTFFQQRNTVVSSTATCIWSGFISFSLLTHTTCLNHRKWLPHKSLQITYQNNGAAVWSKRFPAIVNTTVSIKMCTPVSFITTIQQYLHK